MDKEQLPEQSGKLFKRRISLIKEYLAEMQKAQELCNISGERFKKRAFTNDFAKAQAWHPGSIYGLFKKYREGGEEALAPEYGKNKGKTIISKRLGYLIDPLIIPSSTYREIIASFIDACERAGEKAPCKSTILKHIRVKRDAAGQPYAPPAVKSRQELVEEISNLKEENEALRSKIRKLKDIINGG